jgi:L-lactate dehydrogenase complex protein LldG
MSQARDEILKKLKNAVYPEPEKPVSNEPVFYPIEDSLEEAFKKNLENVDGIVRLFANEKDLFEDLKSFLNSFSRNQIICREPAITNQLNKYDIPFSQNSNLPENIQVGITNCEFLVAHTGSVMVSSAQRGGRQLFVYPNTHVVLAKKSQLVDYLEKAYAGILDRYKDNLPSQITLITGPSRTADIEKTLVLGAHGPRELMVYLY